MLTAIVPFAAAVWKWISAAFIAVISTPLGAAAVMLLVGKPAGAPDTGNKPGGIPTIGAGAADLKATIAIRGGP